MIQIPAQQVAAGHMPHVCPRHGEPAIEMKKMRLISKPPKWAPPLILLGGIVYAIVVMMVRKTVQAAAWPWCEQCKASRARMLGIGLGVLGLGVLLFIVGVALASGDSSGAPLLIFAGFMGLLIGLIVALRGGGQAVAGAFVSQDGNFVEVPKSDPRFGQAMGGRQPQYR
ncbi:hypothetical protein [Dactylosporangium salmoneum]|uniref:hypothetical protein n=1 Tax=Dactylosporangium salmoneum TaxID=53361 RepID=UPI0031E1C610